MKPGKMFLILSIFICILFLTCCENDRSRETVLATIGNKSIEKEAFLWRSELTIRPNNFKNKNTVLNNLITEKILAIRAEEQGLELSSAEKGRIKGIKEQAMRDSLFKKVAYNKVDIDSAEINEFFKWSAREYQMEFYQLRDDKLVAKIDSTLSSDPNITADLFADLQDLTAKKPEHTISFKDDEDFSLLKAVYSKPLQMGETVGPVRLANGSHILMRVQNWKEQIHFGGQADRTAWNKVKEKVHMAYAEKLWQSYQFETMLGKKIEFERKAFEALIKISYEYYLANSNDSLKNKLSEIPDIGQLDMTAPFFTIDGNVWTMDMFKEKLYSHPLVFRSKDIRRENYASLFRIAILDMVTDHYLTLDAYDKSLDKSAQIQILESTWNDAELAANFRKHILDSVLTNNILKEGDDLANYQFWQKYLTDIQKRYADIVRINTAAFEKITLTQIDLLALRAGVPYPVSIPNFPLLISSENLEYFQKVN